MVTVASKLCKVNFFKPRASQSKFIFQETMSDNRTSNHECGDCGKVFATNYNLDRHIQNVHEDSDVSNSDVSDNESNSEEVSEVTTDEEDSEDMEIENSDNEEESAFDDLIQQSKLPYKEKRVELAETYMAENDMDDEEALQAADNDLKHFYRKKLRHVFIRYIDGMFDKRAVSYTHLTLPTIHLV